MKSVLEVSSLILLAIVGASTSVGAQRQGPGRQEQQQQQQQDGQTTRRRNGPGKNSLNTILDQPTPTNAMDSNMMMMMMMTMMLPPRGGSNSTVGPSPPQNQKPLLKNATECGGERGTGHVEGADVTEESQISWQCNFYDRMNNRYDCSGTIINCTPTIIVTAASCFGNEKPSYVTCGDWKIDAPDVSESTRDVSEVIKHPDYDGLDSDIAVVRVSETMPCFKRKVWPACLPNKEMYSYEDWVDADTMVSGWGHPTSTTSQTLRYVQVDPISDNKCKPHIREAKMEICTDTASDFGADACYGDKGGPLVTRATVDTGYSLIGITLDICVNSESLRKNIYTEFSFFMPWVADQFEMTLE